MKLPKPRKLSSGNWFIQLRLDGESISITEPTEKACITSARLVKAEYKAGKREKPVENDITLRQAIDKYIASRSNTLSPSTLMGYHVIRNNRFTHVMNKSLSDIKDWQLICNAEAAICSPKTLQNSWRFIASVLRYVESPVPRITLPQLIKKERLYLDPEQIPVFIKAIKNQPCEIAALLALHGLRRSEICALTWDSIDLKNDRITVNSALVPNEKHEYVQKQTTKNQSSNRFVPIMIPELKEAIKSHKEKAGRIITYDPNMIYKQINRICKINGLPLIGVHGLRHSFASLAYHLRVPEEIAMQIGGWSDYGTMRKIYTHLAQKDIVKHESKMMDFFQNANDIANK